MAENKRLRVLIYTSLFPNSVHPLRGNFIMERIRHLQPLADLSVVAPVPYFPLLNIHSRWQEFSKIPRSENIDGLELTHPRYIVLPKTGMLTHGFSMFLGSIRQVASKLRHETFDLIDAHYVYPDGFAAMMLGSYLRKPVVVSARGSDINVFPKFHTIRPLIRQVLIRADAVIAVSTSLKETMVGLGCPANKIAVIGNGVDSAKFRPSPKAEMRRFLQLPDDRPILLSVGKLTENKGFHVLIDAVAQLRLRRPDVLLVIVGEGPYRSKLELQIQRLGVAHNVRLVGEKAHEDLSAWYCAADLFCLASRSEGCPNVVMEAMACGRPIVATRSAAGSVPPSFGIVVERTHDDFQRNLDEALSRNWDQQAIVAYARSCGWDKVAHLVVSVFSDTVAQRKQTSNVSYC
jgi:glycosyltransferase involved in cell wall biosynthesis